MLAAGVMLGSCRILAPIGAGGMGEVYRARDERLGRDVAVKVIRGDVARDPDRVRRFEQEARAAGALSHPNVCAIHDLGHHEGAPYVVMELLEGESLRERLRGGALPVRKATDYAAQAARGLAAAHAKGIVHRDLKPENLFVTKDGRVKVLDFGLAKLTRPDVVAPSGEPTISIAGTETGAILGTVGYMSPEQVRGEPADARSDLFALGAILYELLTSHRAFHGASTVETLNAILNGEPAPLSQAGKGIPPALELIVRRCLEKSAAERFQNASDLAFDLESLSGSGLEAGIGARGAHVASRRHLALLALALAVVAAATAGGFVSGRRTARPPVPSYQRVTFRRGSVDWARFTGDGQSVVYKAQYVGERRGSLYVQRLGSAEARSLGVSGNLVGVVGGEVAYTHGGTLSRMSLEGGTPRDIAAGIVEAGWSADGSKFAVVRRQRGLDQQLECPIGKVLYRTSGLAVIIRPRISPAGDRVAYCWQPDAYGLSGQVEVVDLEGRRQVLSKGWMSVNTLDWSPDGSEVWFTATRTGVTEALHAVDMKGRLRVLLKTPASLRLLDVARDGRILVNQHQYAYETRGRMAGDSAERDYTWLDQTQFPILSDDGTMLLTNEIGEGGATSGGSFSTYMRRDDGKPPVRLCEGSARDLSADARWALVSVQPENAPPQLRMVPIGAGEAYTLPLGSLAKAWWGFIARDGKRVLVLGEEAGKPGPMSRWVQDLPDGLPRPFGPDTVESQGVTSTPDGRWWAMRRPGGGWMLYPLEGGEPRPLPWVTDSEYPFRWSSDGRWLYVGRDSVPPLSVEMTRIDTRTGRREPVVRVGPPPDLAGVLPRLTGCDLTSNGRSYAYSYNRQFSDLYLVTGLR